MKKRRKKKIFYMTIITLALGYYLSNDIFYRWKNREIRRAEDINKPVFQFSSNNIDSFSISEIKFIKLAGKWFIDGPDRIPANLLKINYFLTHLATIKKSRVIDMNPSVDYGFRNTSISISDQQYLIGGYTYDQNYIYIKHPVGKIFVIGSDLLDHIKTKIVYWFDQEIGINPDKINKIMLTGTDITTPHFELEKISSDWFFITKKKTKTKASDPSVESLILSLKNLRADMIIYNSTIKDEDEIIELSIRNNDGVIDRLKFFKSKPEGFIETSCFYTKNNTSFSYQINCTAQNFLTKSRHLYRESTDFSMSPNNISSIELRSRQYIITFNKVNAGNWDFEGKNVVKKANYLFSLFNDLSYNSICKKKCNIKSNISNLISISFYNSSGEIDKKFLFNLIGETCWFMSSSSKNTFITSKDSYIKIAKLLDSFSNF